EEFAQDEIRRLELARGEAIEDRAEALIELGEAGAAIQDLEPLARTDATRERPVRLLMLAYYRAGRQGEALRVARLHTRRLAEHGLEPSPRLRGLEDRILRHDAGLLPEGTVSSADIRPGRSVRGYELREEVGAGSIGTVYRAFQSSIGREVALRVVDPNLAGEPEFIRRFSEEARVVAALEHPRIVPLYDFWRDPAGAFLVMRWMDGGDLTERLGRPWEPAELGRVFEHLADALGYAHSAGVVHRRIRPSNVLFDADGNAYLADIGLAFPGLTAPDRRPGDEPPSPPELVYGERPSVASDIFDLGVLLAEAASGAPYRGVDTPLETGIREVVHVATAANPADRYPDMAAFRSALVEAIGPTTAPAPRRVRRNPYKGLAPFDEGDRADFYGRDDVTETLVDTVGANGLVAVIGASGSGKSSVVMAGLVPELRDGALPGSDEWSIVCMVPGTDPFDEFYTGLRSAAVGHAMSPIEDPSHELSHAFAASLEGPSSRALLIVDQFEEVFSSDVDDATRTRFLDNLAALADDPSCRIRVVFTMRADFSDRALTHPRLGTRIVESSVLLAPMRPEQVEDVIRRPAARVGVQVEPGLVTEIVRDIAAAPASLPLLQYVLAELFERRVEDRLTVSAYRSLGGVQGVLERRAEATYAALGADTQRACRQLFLRMVHIGDHGEQTRRRLPLTELRGLDRRAAVEDALEAFAAARLLTYDRDPITRTPTVEVAHETVIENWVRYRVWIEEARADLLAHRRLSAAAATWAESGEDPAYLLVEGPLAAALDLTVGDRISLNELEARFVDESRRSAEVQQQIEAERRRREVAAEERSRRRLIVGAAASVVAVAVAVIAIVAFLQWQRAGTLVDVREREGIALELAAESIASLDSSDAARSLRLAVAAADLTLEAGEPVLHEVVDALHRALINPRPDPIIKGAGYELGARIIEFSPDGTGLLLMLADDGGAKIANAATGEEAGRLPPVDPPAIGVQYHPDAEQVMTIHNDGVREWNWHSGSMVSSLEVPGKTSTAAYSSDGSQIAVGDYDGTIRIYNTASGDLVTELTGHKKRVSTIDWGPAGERLVSGSYDGAVLFWDISTGESHLPVADFNYPIRDVDWHMSVDVVVATAGHGMLYAFNASTYEQISLFGDGGTHSESITFTGPGAYVLAAGRDGRARLFDPSSGGEAVVTLPTGGVPLADVAPDPTSLRLATVSVDGTVRIWPSYVGSELQWRGGPPNLYPHIAATPDGSRYLFGQWFPISWGLGAGAIHVIDARTGDELLVRETGGEDPWRDWAITDDGTRIAFAGPTGDIEIVEISTGESVTIPKSANWTGGLAFSRDGDLLAGGGISKTIKVWEVATAREIATLEGHGDREPRYGGSSGEDAGNLGTFDILTDDRVEEVQFRPGGTDLASAGHDGTIRVWDIETGEGRVLHTFNFAAYSLAYSPDGSRIAASDSTGTIVLLDADTGAQVEPAMDRVSGRTWLAYSPDGTHFAGACTDRFAYVWDASTGRIVRRIRGSIYPTSDVAFVNGGTELRVAAGEGFDRGYLLDPEDMVELARSLALGGLTDEECERYLGALCDR
ncbi:MAG: protein kinase, partial [Actinomycetota bacterium]